MGNNNATPGLTEEQRSKLEKENKGKSGSVENKQDQVFLASQGKDAEEQRSKLEKENKGKSPLESGSVETTQEKVFLASEGKDGDEDKEKKNLPDGKTGEGTSETEPQRNELVEDPKAKNVDEKMHQSLVTETDEQLKKQTSVAEGVETVIGTQSVVSKVNTTEFGNEEKKPSAIVETVSASPSLDKTDGPKEEKKINESLEETVPANEVVKIDQETSLEQKTTKVHETKPQEILNLDNRIVADDDVAKADQVISRPSSKESNMMQETNLGVYKEEKATETGGEASLKQEEEKGLEKPKTSETVDVSCLASNKPQETTEAVTETNKEAKLEMQSPAFVSDLKSDEPTEKTPLLCQDKTETHEATIDVEEKTVMLKRSESEKTKAIEMTPELSTKPIEKSEGDDSLKENKGSGDNLLDKKGSMKGRDRKLSRSTSLLGSCLCCATAMN